jgi:hypothetical protein
VPFAALNECAEIRNEDPPCDMTINVIAHLARLPGQQAPCFIWSLLRGREIDLLSQQ